MRRELVNGIIARLIVGGARVRDSARSGPRDRGDVPGWVLVTLMTAGLVIALWAIAGPALTSVFTSAIARVTGQIG